MSYEVQVEREFAIDRAAMWRLWTDPEHAARWMRPSVEDFAPTIASIDPRPGGQYRFEMITADGLALAVAGVFVDLVEPERLAFTWSWEGSGEESFVEVTLTEVTDGTRIRVLHSKLSSQESAREHERGWVGCLESMHVLY